MTPNVTLAAVTVADQQAYRGTTCTTIVTRYDILTQKHLSAILLASVVLFLKQHFLVLDVIGLHYKATRTCTAA